MNLSITFYYFKVYQSIYPDPSVPWSKPPSRLLLINRLLQIVSAMLLVCEDYLMDKVDFYVILLPLCILSSVMLLLQVFNIAFYSRIADSVILLRDVIIWATTFYGLMINLINKKSDYSFCILTLVTVIVMYLALFLHKMAML